MAEYVQATGAGLDRLVEMHCDTTYQIVNVHKLKSPASTITGYDDHAWALEATWGLEMSVLCLSDYNT